MYLDVLCSCVIGKNEGRLAIIGETEKGLPGTDGYQILVTFLLEIPHWLVIDLSGGFFVEELRLGFDLESSGSIMAAQASRAGFIFFQRKIAGPLRDPNGYLHATARLVRSVMEETRGKLARRSREGLEAVIARIERSPTEHNLA